MLYAPVPYFEAKPRRAVSLNEFSGAVVPNDVSPEVLAVLNKHNIPYKKYGTRYDESARSKAVVQFRQSLAKKGESVLFQRQNQADPRGRIKFGDEATVIQLFEKADASTVLHESAHFFFEAMSGMADVSPRMATDLATLREFAGLKDGDRITVDAHERVARAFEAYMREGRAPTEELATVFARIRDWMVNLYRSIMDLDIELTDEVRGVFDRLLATDEQLAKNPLPTDLRAELDQADVNIGLIQAQNSARDRALACVMRAM